MTHTQKKQHTKKKSLFALHIIASVTRIRLENIYDSKIDIVISPGGKYAFCFLRVQKNLPGNENIFLLS